MTKLLLAALLGAFIISSVANATDDVAQVSGKVTAKKIKVESKIEPIRIVPKQDRNIASEDDGFVPVLTPKPKKTAHKLPQKRKPAAKCAGSKCLKKKS